MIFDKSLNRVSDRNQHIYNLVDKEAINRDIAKDVVSERMAQETRTGHFLETVANYILESPNIDSGRKVEESFYPSERYYWSKSSVAKNLLVSTDKLNNYPAKMDKEVNQGALTELFKFENIGISEIRRVITLGLLTPEVRDRIDNPDLRDAISWLCEEILSSMTCQDREFIANFDGKSNISKIAYKLGMSHQNVSKKLKKICKNAEKWLRN
ncbi:hypothetical protein [Limosilactobacillus reuteri]|uniref:hypothetical protein n=1 Tax=Limosilactobacillus reuteri TaxID=1598 RepID=UPI001E38D1A2|nr:hypothetical protein [Limosilactobacillus reuteri]MCC4466858.1 hypothetical protein [Limosilactobacillus reuteri]MCC4472896.1 hypothetical protein [Limosilactobacillus reuteri]